ncbi:MAG: ATP-grasp domain-containing protein [Planctomycetota bacterium]|jgi:biotin carboxylase
MRNYEGKTLMVVGAGFGQLPAILTAKKMGLKVIAIDKNADALGMKYADIALPIDVVDIDGATEAGRKYRIDGIMTMQTELPVPTIGKVVDELGLNGVRFEVAKTCTNKIEARRRFAERNIPQPDFRIVSTYEEAADAAKEIKFPCVTKPPDNSGSRGITKVINMNGMESAFMQAIRCSRKEKVLVEEFVEGIEVGAQCFSINGHCEKVLVHNDTMSRPPCMIPTGHSFPSMLDEKTLGETEEAIAATVDALEIETGPSNIDLILDKNFKPVVIEVGARIGATCLPELVYYHTGIDWIKAAILASLGETPDLTVAQSTPCAALILEAPENGELAGYSIPGEIKKVEGLLEIEVTAEIGQIVNKLTKGTDRIGKVVVTDKTVEAAKRKAEWIKSRVTFDINKTAEVPISKH